MVTIGADPELFVLDTKRRVIVPMCGVLKGTKDRPFDLGGGFAVQWDNVMLEYNIPPTSSVGGRWTSECTTQVLQNLTIGAELALKHARDVTGSSHLAYSPNACATFTASTLRKNFGELPFSFGCSPEFSVERRGEQVPVIRADDPFWRHPAKENRVDRFAGGHIHIGYDNPDGVPPWVVAGLCDIFVMPLALYYGNGGRRATHYGSPGRFRPTPYGIEYRTPSAEWVASRVTGAWSKYRAGYLNNPSVTHHHLVDAAALVGSLVEAVPAQILADCFRAAYRVVAGDRHAARMNVDVTLDWFASGAEQHGDEVRRAIIGVRSAPTAEVRKTIEDAMGW
jgi:hypothetical protein